ncbi:hypothetical protein [Streptococcus mutans]|nr:hypothetical protein [Streptococcus mutans]
MRAIDNDRLSSSSSTNASRYGGLPKLSTSSPPAIRTITSGSRRRS